MNNPHVPIMTHCKATPHQYVTISILLLSSSDIPVYTLWGGSRRLQGIPKSPLDAQGTGSWLSQAYAWVIIYPESTKGGSLFRTFETFFYFK